MTPFDALRLPFAYLTLADLLFLVCGMLVFRRADVGPSRNPFGPFWVLGLYMILVGYFSGALFNGSAPAMDSVTNGLQLAFVFAYLPWLIARYGQMDHLLLLRTFVLGLTASVVAGAVIQTYFPGMHGTLSSLGLYSTSERRFGAFIGSNGLAKLIASMVPIVILLIVSKRFDVRSGAVVLVTLLFGLVLTASNGGALALAVGLVSILLLVRGPKVRRVLFAVMVLTAGLVWLGVRVLGLNTSVFTTRVYETLLAGDIESAGSFEQKLAIVRVALGELARNPLLGRGAGWFADAFGINVHNTYLLIWVEAGAFGLLGLILILTTQATLSLRMGRFAQPSPLAGLALSFLIVFSFNLLTGTDMYQRFRILPLALLAFVLDAEFRRLLSESPDHGRGRGEDSMTAGASS
ncbi:O-antigen ligase family protein [Ornithinimicrobium kibberense]|uniref:O-antigen ligase family protein n=2 Tax=Ornithinimicrobium kibberense TaxID=282060 RepID=A0ABV5V6R5_9MICO|nr:O-antigen ligase family protein [Ornithinimicrobium kibberense]